MLEGLVGEHGLHQRTPATNPPAFAGLRYLFALPCALPPDSISYQSEAAKLPEETLVRVRGHFLDRGTSFEETLRELTADEASKPLAGNGERVVAHVCHVRFYLDVLAEYMTGERTGKTNWDESWKRTVASESEWNEICPGLGKSYRNVVKILLALEQSDDSDFASGAISLVAHSAFHLGAIRQIMDQLTSGKTAQGA